VTAGKRISAIAHAADCQPMRVPKKLERWRGMVNQALQNEFDPNSGEHEKGRRRKNAVTSDEKPCQGERKRACDDEASDRRKQRADEIEGREANCCEVSRIARSALRVARAATASATISSPAIAALVTSNHRRAWALTLIESGC